MCNENTILSMASNKSYVESVIDEYDKYPLGNFAEKAISIFSEAKNYYCGNAVYTNGIEDGFSCIASMSDDVIQQYVLDCLAHKKMQEKWDAFLMQYQSIIRSADRKIKAFPSVVSYLVAKNHSLHSQIKNIFIRYYEKAIKHKSQTLCRRQYLNYDLNIDEFQCYQMCFCLYQATQEDNQILSDIRMCFVNKFTAHDQYVKKILKNTDSKDLERISRCFAPFVGVMIENLKSNISGGKDLETIVILNELLSFHKGTEERKWIEPFCHAFFMTKYQDPHILSKKFISSFRQEVQDNVPPALIDLTAREMVDTLAKVLISIATKYNHAACNPFRLNAVWYFIEARKNETEQLLNSYLSSCYLKEYFGNGILVEDYFDILVKGTATLYERASSESKEDAQLSARRKKEKMIEASVAMDVWEGFLLYIKQYLDNRSRALNDKSIEIVSCKEVSINEPDEKDKEIEALKKKLSQLKSQESNVKALNAALSAAKKENESLKEQLREEQKNKKELIGLRNYVYEISSEPEKKVLQSNGLSIEEMAEYLNKNVRGVLLGGHINFHNKLSKYLPDWKKYLPGKYIDNSTLKATDILVFYTDHIDHPSYLSAIANVRNSDCKLLYLHNVNIEYVIKQMYDFAINT